LTPSTGKYVSVQLRRKEEIILDILRQDEMYGLEIVKRSNGALRKGTVYVHLSGMEERGLIEGRTEDAHERMLVDFGRRKIKMPPRRRYHVTSKGWELFLSRNSLLPKARIV
jgi:DNA-binding PadR family transcriptional regulator